jgi:hypothetical protein
MRLGLSSSVVLWLAVGCGGSTGVASSGSHKDAGPSRADSGKADGSSSSTSDAAGPKAGGDAGASCSGSCDDGVECTDDGCNSGTGRCTHVPNHEKCSGQTGAVCDRTLGCGLVHCVSATECDDGVFCNGAERCVAGQCAAGSVPPVDDGVACTKDRCEEPNRIRHMADDKACDDGKLCNGQERCDTKSGCQPGSAPTLDDAIDCTLDSCEESAQAVVHTPMDSRCDDGDSCTRDRCAIAAGCMHPHDGNACPCTPSGACNPFAASSTCSVDETCRPSASGTSCQTLGSPIRAEGDPCPGAPDQLTCAPGLLCADFGGGSKCARMCPKDSVGSCPSGQACTGTIQGEACVAVCRPFPAPCDPVAQDCSDPNDTCTFATHPETGAPYIGCRPIGTRTRGQTCGVSVGSCGHRQVCLSSAGVAVCHELCDPSGNRLGCTDPAQSCTGRSTIYAVAFCQ